LDARFRRRERFRHRAAEFANRLAHFAAHLEVRLIGALSDVTEQMEAQKERQALSRSIINAQERERQRVARDLHDGVNQLLASAKYRLGSLADQAQTRASTEGVLKVRDVIEKALSEVRSISRNLRPSELDDLGLVAALRSLAHEFHERTGITTRFRSQRPECPPHTPKEVEMTIYRIAQEALTNCAKHASAMRVDLRLSASDGRVTFTISDDGSGFDLASVAQGAKAPGLGLLSMRERAEFMGGTLTVDSVPGKGTRITVELPTRDETRADSAAVSG